MAGKTSPMCARCAKVLCYPSIKATEKPPIDEAPAFCPMKLMPDIIVKSVAEYDKEKVHKFARLASIQEAECYERTPEGIRTKIPRVEELIQFSKKCGYKKLGIAFCTGLANEANILTDILEAKGFEVVSVRCKVGAIPKEQIGIKGEEKIAGLEMWESMCNPITQAEIINESKVDFAIMLGLCIGHDTLFIKYCRVPMTVLAVKDRVTGHNPLAALYNSNSYYRRLKTRAVPRKLT